MRWMVIATAAFSFASPAGAQRAGQLISADPVVDTPGGMQAWRIIYWTTTGKSAPIRASRGLAWAPPV